MIDDIALGQLGPQNASHLTNPGSNIASGFLPVICPLNTATQTYPAAKDEITHYLLHWPSLLSRSGMAGGRLVHDFKEERNVNLREGGKPKSEWDIFNHLLLRDP